MRDSLTYLRYTLKILLRADGWLILPIAILSIVTIWTVYLNTGDPIPQVLYIGQAEYLGSLIAMFLCAGLLDPEMRLGAAELIFSKPRRAAVMVLIRFGVAIALTMGLIAGMFGIYAIFVKSASPGWPLLLALPSCLFMGSVALAIGVQARTPLAGVGFAAGFWLWNATFGVVFHPLLLLSGGLMTSQNVGESFGINLVWNKACLTLVSICLLLWTVRRVGRAGSDPGGSSAPAGAWPRVSRFVWISVGIFLYFWSGAAVRLTEFNRTPAGLDDESLNGRTRRWPGTSPLQSFNAMRQALDVYGPVPMGRLFGPGLDHFAEGLGAGLDPNDDHMRDRQRAAARDAQRNGGVWSVRARVLDAALADAPGPLRFGSHGILPLSNEPKWITAASLDSERWWVVRRPSGPDPVGARRSIAVALHLARDPATTIEARSIAMALAQEDWDFARSSELRRSIAADYPSTPAAIQAVMGDAGLQSDPERLTELIDLTWPIYYHQSDSERVNLARMLAQSEMRAGDFAGARSLLHSALAMARQMESRRNDSSNGPPLSTIIQRDLDGSAAASTRVMLAGGFNAVVPAPRPPAFPVSMKVMADGRPLAGVAVALVAPADLGVVLPATASGNWLQPQAARSEFQLPAGHPRGFSTDETPEAWRGSSLAEQLRRLPWSTARTDHNGVAHWGAVRPGQYGVALHFSESAHPDAARLSLVPLSAPLIVSGPGASLPDLVLRQPVATRVRLDDGPPEIAWSPVKGAVRYRAAVRLCARYLHRLEELDGDGVGAVPSDPEVIWWRDDLTTPRAVMDPAHFVGPAGSGRGDGLSTLFRYTCTVEALDRDGKVLATSESLRGAVPWTVRYHWSAIRPTGKTRPPVAIQGMQSFGWPDDELREVDTQSPLADLLDGRPSRAVLAVHTIPATKLPSIESDGHGLPSRRPLAPPAGPAMPGLPGAGPPNGMPFPSGGMPVPQGVPRPGSVPLGMTMAMRPGIMAPGGKPLPPGSGSASAVPPGRIGPHGGVPPLPPGAPFHGGPGPMPHGRSPDRPPASARPPAAFTPSRTLTPPGPQGGQHPIPSPAHSTGQITVVLDTLDASTATRWWLPDSAKAGLGGLVLSAVASLKPLDGMLRLPPSARTVRLSGNSRFTADVAVRVLGGSTRHVIARPDPSAPEQMSGSESVTLPDHSEGITEIRIRPSGPSLTLSSVGADVQPEPGIFAALRGAAGASELRLSNLDIEPSTVSVSLGDRSYARLTLPAGSAVLLTLPADTGAREVVVQSRDQTQRIPLAKAVAPG